MKLKSQLSLLLFLSLFSCTLFFNKAVDAQVSKSLSSRIIISDQLMLGSVEITDLTNDYNVIAETENKGKSENIVVNDPQVVSIQDINEDILIVDKIVNLGEKVWNIVQKGKPLLNYSGSVASALPANTLRWDQLENWKSPKSKVVRITYKNVLGIEVARFTYRIVLLYGGSVNGIGKYIAYATIEPLEIISTYMYSFDASASVASVYNTGSKENPVAALILNINWTVETIFKKVLINHAYALDGNGQINELGNTEFLELN